MNNMLFTREQISIIEDNSEKCGVSRFQLMENAGKAAFETVMRLYGGCIGSAVVICGSGNNGGDGLVTARLFSERGIDTTVILACGKMKTDIAKAMFARLKNVKVIDYSAEKVNAVAAVFSADIIIDAIFGTGFHGEVKGGAAEIISAISDLKDRVVSLDLPSGAECDSGAVSNICVSAKLTVAFIAKKPCHILYPAADYCGEVETVDISVPNDAYIKENIHIINESDIKPVFAKNRPNVCNKYDFGRALLICGSYGMAGAAKIAACAAVKCGTGLVSVCLPKSIYGIVSANLSEAVFRPLDENDNGRLSAKSCSEIIKLVEKASAVLIGCGMGCDNDTKSVVSAVISSANCPIIIDADGINCVASNINILREAKSPVILTPHMGEMSRLCGISVKQIESDILNIGSTFSRNNNVILVMKGPRTMVFTPDGVVYVNTEADSGMATAGTGDMLAGMIVSFLAQGIDPVKSVCSAVYLHGKSGVMAASLHSRRAMTPTNMTECLESLFLQYETECD